MSIFFDFDVGVSGRRFRRAVNGDKYNIELILDRNLTDPLFGPLDIGELIERSTLSICMINEDKEVVGFLSLCDHPNVLGVDPDEWETWIRNMFQKYYLSRNTLFIHFMCCNDEVGDYFLEEALDSVFRNDAYLLQIVLVVSYDRDADYLLKNQAFKKRNMYKYCSRIIDDCESLHSLYVAIRQDYCPKLKIRRAVEEDNDDIVEILDKRCSKLKEMYGEYYISELLGRHPESTRKIIVAEYQDHAVGVMCLNSYVNYKNLHSMYELRPYYGLMKATPLEKEQLTRSNLLLETFGIPIMTGKWSPFHSPPMNEEILLPSETLQVPSRQRQSKENLCRNSVIDKKKGKVNFKHLAGVKIKSGRLRQSGDPSDKGYERSPTPSEASHISFVDMMLDDEEFDYEIVNIDLSLMSLSEAISSELLLNMDNTSQNSLTTVKKEQPKRKTQSSCNRNIIKSDSEQSIYSGKPNAFSIELFGLREDVDESNGFDLLEAAFEFMKDYDYCIIQVPSADKSFSLLQHFCFVPTKTRDSSNYSLFIAHRCSVLGKLRVRKAEIMDIPFITRFLQNVELADTMYTIENGLLEKEAYQAYVFTSGLSLIGIGILEPPEQLNFIRCKFNIDPYHNHKYHLPGMGEQSGFSAVKLIIVYPVFEVHFRFFAREIMRLSQSTSLIWMTAYRSKLVAHKANTLVTAMVPLLPRRSDIDYGAAPELMKMSAMAKNMLAFSTWFLDKKLTSVPKANVTTRIVVLGGSRTAMAFFDTLLFGQSSSYLTFTNVTLISSHGLPYVRQSNKAVESMFTKFNNNSDKFMKTVPYTFYVNTVQGIMNEINNQDKYVSLTSGKRYYYDMLFLLFGKQYQHPDYLKPLLQQNMKLTEDAPYVRMDVPKKLSEPEAFSCSTPENVFIVNHVVEAKAALNYVKNLLNDEFDFQIVVYGATIHAYCCITALLEIHIPPESIVFVDPFPPEDHRKVRVSVFHNTNVDETVGKLLRTLKIKVYSSYYFQSWTVCGNIATHVQFLSYCQMIKLECSAFFYYGKRGVNAEAFLAMHNCGMAYDGGILIDHQFRTNDASIYSAGPVTAYHRRYFAENKKQKYYDSYEVGEKLGTQIRNQLDPLFTSISTESKTSVKVFSSLFSETSPSYSSASSRSLKFKDEQSTCTSVPNFVKPKVTYCKLPGGLQYLDVRPPGKKIPHHYLQSLDFNGVVMETFVTGYFKIHMTPDMIVDGLTCLTFEKYSLENYKNIYGLSSTVLNNVHLKYATKKLNNFFEYFRSPWTCFLHHDQADELFDMVKELLPKGHSQGKTLREALRTISATLTNSTYQTNKAKLRKKFEASPYIEAVTEYVIEWLSENEVLLPMYMQPTQGAEYVYDMDANPVLKKRRRFLKELLKKVI